MVAVGSALEGRLRSLPGVLDCSLNDAGVALLVHPEIDTRMLKARAQAIFAELGDPRPLVLVGGYPAPGRRGVLRRFGRTDATPLSLVVFAILVLCLLAVVPIQPSNRVAPSSTPSLDAPLAEAANGHDLAPDLFRTVGSFGRRAASARLAAAAAAASAPVAAAAVVAEAPARPKPSGRARAAAHHTAAAALAPALSIGAAAAEPVCAPGNSAAHRQRPKQPKNVGRAC